MISKPALLRSVISFVCLMVIAIGRAPVDGATLNFQAANFEILDARTLHRIGAAHFEVTTPAPGIQVVTSKSRYDAGQYDVERDTFNTNASGPLPRMVAYEHTFYKPDGALFLQSKVDFRTGEVECTSYPGGKPKAASAKFSFSPSSYAGAAIVLPLLNSIRHGNKAPMTLTDVVCGPGPRIVQVSTRMLPPSRWNGYPDKVVRTDIKPDFGWLDYVLAPFLPEMHLWFDPANGVQLAGAQYSRYYRGPEIILRHTLPESPAAAVTQTNGRTITAR